RLYSEFWAKVGCAIIFVGFNLTFFPQFILGTRGMPRRYARYEPEFTWLHQMSTIGSLLLGLGLLVAAAVLVLSLIRGRRAPANPWGAATMEWRCSSPPPHHNFDTPPPVTDPYDYHLVAPNSVGEGYDFQDTVPVEIELPQEEPAAV